MKIKIPKPEFGKKSIIFTAVAVLLTAADLISKYLEEKFHPWELKIIPGVVELSSGYRNPGCAFSFLADRPEVGQPILIAVTFVMLAVLIALFIFLPEKFTLLKFAIAMVAAGAVGNLVDRIMFFEVRDWFGLWMLGLTYCNLADFWIVIGTVIAAVDLLFLNEWAVIPLTKRAKAAQAEREAAKKQVDAEKDIGADEDGE